MSSRASSTLQTCRTPTSSYAPAANNAYPTSSFGKQPTANSCSFPFTGPTSTERSWSRRLPNTAAGSAGLGVLSRRRDPEVVVGAEPKRRTRYWEWHMSGFSELAIRTISALVLAPLAIGAAYLGGLPFVLFCGLAAIGIWWEWATLSAEVVRSVIATGVGALIA